MVHNQKTKQAAERLYVEESLSVTEIADLLGVPARTIHRWMADSKEKSEEFDWDEQKKIFFLSPTVMVDIYARTFKRWILRIQKSIDVMVDVQIADAIAKHISTLKKLDPRFNYLGTILDVIQITDEYLEKHDSPLRAKMGRHWPAIQEKIREIATLDSPLWYSTR